MSQGGPTTRQRLLELIESPSLSVHFQPIVDVHDGQIIAYEALTRLAPGAGFPHAGELFHAAADEHLLWELEAVTRRNSIRAAAHWPRHTRLFLNSSPVVFSDARFAAQLSADLAGAPDLRPERIVLEITELSDDQYIPGMTEQVRALSAAGFNVALDDAGAGASGLNRMMSLRPQWVKLDREFMRDIGSDMFRQNLVRFFVHFARLSGVSVVAEGIETAEELQTVISLGVRYAQGYYLGRPGTREQTMDPAFVAAVRDRWAAVEAAMPSEVLEPTLGAICRPVGECSSHATMAEACQALARFPDAAGVLVSRRGGYGWLARGAMESRDPEVRLADHTGLGPVLALHADLTVNEALTALCTRDDDRLPDPILVTDGERARGIVRCRDLLRVAASDGRLAASGRARLTGLPSRVKADQHLTSILARPTLAGPGIHTDAAFVDLRAFAEFNNQHGNARGDALIRELAELISAVVVSSAPETFVAHLGDDRFLLTASAGALSTHLQRLAAAFDDQQAETLGPGPVRPSLRILYLPAVFGGLKHPRDLYRLEQRLREQTRDRDQPGALRASSVFVHGPTSPARQAA